MRIRSIKPEFWRSDDVTALSWEDRLLFIALWSYVDDNGVGSDRLVAITGDLFAGDMLDNPRETVARVSRGLQSLFEAGLIYRYTVGGHDYLEVCTWDKHQRIDRPNKGRYPRHDAENATIRESVASPRECPATGTEEQGNRGTGFKTLARSADADTSEHESSEPDSQVRKADTRTPDPQGFEEFYQAYPRHVGRRKAVAAYQAALKRANADTIREGATKLAQDPNLPSPKYIPHPATWLNRDGWDDDPLPPPFDTPGDGLNARDRRYLDLRTHMQELDAQRSANPPQPPLEMIGGTPWPSA